jgi:hypothetical protein
MDVDEAGHDQMAAGVDPPLGVGKMFGFADGNDAAVFDAEVGPSLAIRGNESAAADNEIQHRSVVDLLVFAHYTTFV